MVDQALGRSDASIQQKALGPKLVRCFLRLPANVPLQRFFVKLSVQTKGGQRIPKQVKTLELQIQNFGAVESNELHSTVRLCQMLPQTSA